MGFNSGFKGLSVLSVFFSKICVGFFFNFEKAVSETRGILQKVLVMTP
jgi:hypothetical protein